VLVAEHHHQIHGAPIEPLSHLLPVGAETRLDGGGAIHRPKMKA
jgi:hypothetical protein